MLLQFLHRRLQLSIPIGSKLADERFLQELIDRQVLFLPQQHGRLADVPAVVIDALELAEVLHPYVGLTIAASLLDGTIAATLVIIAGEHTVLAIDDGCHQVAFPVHVGHALLVDNSPRLGRQFIPNERQDFFNLFYLFQFQGSTGITLDAAGTEADKSHRNFSFSTSKLTTTSPICNTS